MTRADARVAELAVLQLGLVSRKQVLEAGVSRDTLKSRVRTGAWRAVAPGVYEVLPFPDSHERRLWRALLAAGEPALVSHEAAAQKLGIMGFPRGVVSILVPNGDHHRIDGVAIRQTRDVWRPEWTTHRDGLPVTSPARTFVDLAARHRRGRMAAAIDEAKTAGLVAIPDIGKCLAAVARRGKPGVVTLAAVLDAHGPGWVPAQSTLERRFFEMLRAHGEPAPKRQVPLPTRPGLGRGLVDAAYIEARLIIEVDGRRWHTRIADLHRDHTRDAEAARLGWLTLRVLYEDIRHDPAETVARIRDTRLIRTPAAA